MKILAFFLIILAIGSIANSKKNKNSKHKSADKTKKSIKTEKMDGPIDDFVNPKNAVIII
jgi:hypothetical protein